MENNENKIMGIAFGSLVIFLMILSFGIVIGSKRGYKAGLVDGLKKSAEMGQVVMTPSSSGLVQLHEVKTYVKLFQFYDGDRRYVCGEKKRWGSAFMGFEEPKNSVERITSDPIYDRDGRLIGIVPYGPPETR